MSKDDKKGKVAGPEGGDAHQPSKGEQEHQEGQGEDAATVMLEVPPGGFAGAEAAFGEDEDATTLVDTAAAMAAANAVEGDGGTSGPADDDETPPVMWVNPNKKRDTGEHAPEGHEEAPPDIMEASDLGVVLLGTGSHEAVEVTGEDDPDRTVVYDNPLAEAERRLAEEELGEDPDDEDDDDLGAPTQALNVADIMAAMSGEHAPVTTGDEPVAQDDEDDDEPEGAATMALNVEEILAASGQYQAAQADETADEQPEDEEEEEDEGAPTMALNVEEIMAASGQYQQAEADRDDDEEDEEDDDDEQGAATQALSLDEIMAAQARATRDDLEAVGEEQATVMLEVGAGADEGAEATVMLDVGADDEAEATRMLDVGADDEAEATRMLDVGDGEEEDVDGAFETVMLDAGASAESAEHMATVMLDQHEAQVSAEHEALEADGAVKMGAAAKTKNLFEDGAEDIVDQDDEAADFTADPRMAEVGDLIADRYRLNKLLGQGGFAVVFRGEDEAISGEVAVKVLQAEKSLDPEFAQRFKDEVKVVRHLQHPNTIKITDTGETDKGCLYMVMEYVDGKELDEVIKEEGAMDPARTVKLGKQILRSLAEAHEKGVIHRDLKPQNVMMTSMGGEDDYVKVLDFGIAKALEADLTQAQTKTGVVFCTPRYAPPEILTGRKVSAAADVYALGLMMSEMLAGNPVIAAPSDAEAIAYQLSPEPPPIPPEILGTPLGKVLQKATDKDVDKRYKDAGEMLDAINKIGQEHLPTMPLLITTANPTLTGQVKFESTLQMAAKGASEATVKVGQAAAAERRTPVAAIAAGILALAAVIALIFIVTSQRTGGVDTTDGGMVETDTGVVAPGEDVGGQVAAVDTPRGPSARDVLAARLAASDWEAGSWLDEEDEPTPSTTRSRTRIRVVTRNETTGQEEVREFNIQPIDAAAPGTGDGTGDGPEVAAVPTELTPEVRALIERQLALEAGTGMGTGGGLAILSIDTVDEDDAVDEDAQKLEQERVEALYESAQGLSNALDVLDAALDTGAMEQQEATARRIFLTQNMVEVLVSLDRCDAAENRLNTALDEVGEVPDTNLADVELMRGDIASCRERVAERQRQQRWEASAYRARLRAGNEAYEQAQAVPEDDLEARRALLYQSLTARQEAIEMLETALNQGIVPEQHREAAGRDLARLNQLVMITMYDLDLNEAAQVQAEELERNAELLPEDEREAVNEIAAAVEEEDVAEQERIVAELQQPEGTGQAAPDGTGQTAVAVGPDGTGTGTGAVAMAPDGTGQAPVETVSAFDAEIMRLLENSFVSRERALDAEDNLREIERDREEAEQAVVTIDYGCETDADCDEEGQVCLDRACQLPPEPPGPPVFRVRVVIDSEPSRVRVYRDGEPLGRTPFDDEIESEDAEVVLSLRKTDYETEELTIPMTEVTEFQAEVEMQLRNVFGRTQTLSERLRNRR